WNNKLDVEIDDDVSNEIQILSIGNDTIYLTNGGFVKLPAETDPVFTAWDKNTGIAISESQITDLDHFTTADETDPIFDSSISKGITATDTSNWNNKLDVEIDDDVTNEIQILSIGNDTIYLTNGGFVKLPADTAWTISGNNMYSTPSGNIGIGTDNPNYKLDIFGDVVAEGFRIRRVSDGNETVHKIMDAGGSIQYYNSSGNRGHYFFTNDGSTVESRMSIMGDGKVGIGTTTPSNTLTVDGTADFTGSVSIGASNADASALLDVSSTEKGILIPRMTASQRGNIANPATGLLLYQIDGSSGLYYNAGSPSSSNWIQLSSTLITQLADADGNTKIQVEESTNENHIRFDIDGYEAMTINNYKKVGIGTTTPSNILSVNGDADFVGDVSIGSAVAAPSAILDLNSTSKGFLPPRLTKAEITAIVNPENGLQVYNIDDNRFYFFDGVDEQWKEIAIGTGFVNKSCGIIFDRDGNSYKTIQIGTQCWMAENLATTTFNNTLPIPLVIDNTEWVNLTTPAYCWYDNDKVTYGDTYGALYNWYAVNEGNLCPAGWHVPSDADWCILLQEIDATVICYSDVGFIGIDAGLHLKNDSGWPSDCNGDNSSDFSALPGGLRRLGSSFSVTGTGYWWSSTEFNNNPIFVSLHSWSSAVERDVYDKSYGLSIRCVKD
ncbi:MAG: hypothetical protein HN778_20345, partial [Prolixibacteraceae bacterium]|nr:hypothetical protein [Prolixibacteraceae bacterium]